MYPERLNFLNEFDKFYKLMVEQSKQNVIDEREFYLLIANKCEAKAKALHYNKKKG